METSFCGPHCQVCYCCYCCTGLPIELNQLGMNGGCIGKIWGTRREMLVISFATGCLGQVIFNGSISPWTPSNAVPSFHSFMPRNSNIFPMFKCITVPQTSLAGSLNPGLFIKLFSFKALWIYFMFLDGGPTDATEKSKPWRKKEANMWQIFRKRTSNSGGKYFNMPTV